MSVHVVLNATAYDGMPSGARSRAVGIAAALVDLGARVSLVTPVEHSFRTLVEEELGRTLPPGAVAEIPSPFSCARPVHRAVRSPAWLRRHVPRDADLFLTDFYPVIDEVRTALTVHDLRYLAAPRHVPAVRAAWFRAAYPRQARRAWRIVVPTRTVAAEVGRHLGVEGSRVLVAPNARLRAWREAAAADGVRDHLLAVGVVESRKDLATAVRAVRAAADAGGPVLPLVVAGRPGREAAALARDAADLERRGLFRHEGVVSDRRLVDLCSRAAALVHPSRYEGFGMTVLEAMSLGVPVLAARCDAVEEVGGAVAHWLPPGDVDAWASAIIHLCNGYRVADDERRAAVERAGAYSWRTAAQVLLKAL